MTNQLGTTVWIDVWGRTVAWELSTDTGQDPIVGAIANATLSGILNQWEGDMVNYDVSYGAGAFISVNDSASLLFESDTGTRKRIILPAPKLFVFQDDGETVDGPSIAPLIAVLETTLALPDGTGGLTFVGGQRERRTRREDSF